VEPYDHLNLGFRPADLKRLCVQAGLDVQHCAITSRETRAPHFEVITLHALRAAGK
jgi:ArsR family transcriptional regulator